jgi:cytosine/adenosine deaminase-related metal-dependent hydrolase
LGASARNLVPLQHDPVGVVVSSAHVGNVETVIVDGRVVKRGGVLVDSGLSAAREALAASARRIVH